jgi:DNA-binding beta-propeller fold protein YncE
MTTMRTLRAALPLGICFAALPQVRASDSVPAGATTYEVSTTLHVGGKGGWDYLTVDPEHKLLFVPRSTHTLVLDAGNGNTVADIAGQKRNHGVALAPRAGRGFISDGEDASVVIFDLKTYAVLGKVAVQPDADGIIYDPASDRILLVCGDAGVLIPISPDVNASAGHAEAAIELGGKPEFLVADRQGRAYVNLVDKAQVAVVDTKSMKVVDHWSTAPGGSPVGMSMDREHRRLFIGCRNPKTLIVMSADDGKVLASLPIGAGVDATQFDGDAFASCRDGTLAVARESSPGKFEIVQTVRTPAGARTMGIDPLTHTLYLPTAEFLPPADANSRPSPKPDSFMIVVVKPNGSG